MKLIHRWATKPAIDYGLAHTVARAASNASMLAIVLAVIS